MDDILIRGGLVVDGSGAPARRADVALRDGRIRAIGELSGPARETIDATGRIVAPGFVDVHTHYDAQVFWDPTVSPSLYHGVTTVVGGNCGFSIAPLTPDAGEYLMRMLARVEGMPLASLREGVPWSWSSFGEYLGLLDGRLAVNAGFMVGHSAIRRVVMGERAVGASATPAELDAMKALLRRSLSEGGLGFSSTRSAAHNDADGQPVPSRHATLEELYALCRVTGEFPGTSLEMLPGTSTFSEEDKEILTRMSLEAQRALNWNLIAPRSDMPEVAINQLAASDYAAERGAVVLALTVPQEIVGRVNLHSAFGFDALPRWAKIMQLSIDERMKALADPSVRAELRRGAEEQGAGPLKALTRWGQIAVEETFAPQNAGLKGRTLDSIAKERGVDPFDLLLDLALSEGLRTSFSSPAEGQTDAESWRLRGESWTDPRTIVGASDAGAHLDMIDTFAFTTQLLGRGVREMKLVSLEEGVRQLTDVPARLYGLRERGRLEVGFHADVVVFDGDRIAKGPTYTRADLPADAARLYADAIGVDHVIVNGNVVVRDGAETGARPGTILRSGRDTRTVPLETWIADIRAARSAS
ncbi:MAG: amidohydrolase family protein [Deltaproteobacteria bacterium]|nr:amidohydrolase family protein [Deltaproteobacteria bacterium]